VNCAVMVPQLVVQVGLPLPPELETVSPTLMIWLGYPVKLLPTVSVVTLILVVSELLLVRRAPQAQLPRPLYEAACVASGDAPEVGARCATGAAGRPRPVVGAAGNAATGPDGRRGIILVIVPVGRGTRAGGRACQRRRSGTQKKGAHLGQAVSVHPHGLIDGV